MTSTPPPLISVIVPTRNRPTLLQRAVDSIVAQTYRPIEIVIVDNASDAPVSVRSGDVPCIVHRNAQMLKAAPNRNLGASLCSGELVAFLDDDDTFMPSKFSLLVAAMDGVELCYGNTRMVGRDGRELGLGRGRGGIDKLMLRRYIHPNATLMRRKAFDAVRFDERMTTYEDVDFIFRFFLKYPIRHVDEIVAVWNRDGRPDQLTTRNLRRSYANWLILCERFALHIDCYPPVSRLYYRKMFLLALTQFEAGVALRYLSKFARYGLRAGAA